jgi:adenosine deaminase
MTRPEETEACMHQQIRKVELHCHMGGLPHPSMLRHLQRKSVPLALQADALAAFYPVENYDDFVRWFEGVRPLEADLGTFRPLLALHIDGLKAQNVVYTEIMIEGRFLPRDKAELIGKFRAFREWVTEHENGETQVEFLVVFGRNRTPEEAEKIADRILALYETGLVVGVALAGPEQGYPVRPLRRIFARFREAGLGIEIHAGEWCGPDSVWDALEHGFPDRIGHGIAVFDDLKLVRRFQEKQIHIEMCPTSNVKTGSVRVIEEHPVRRARDLRLNFSINTDGPGWSECSMASEFRLLSKMFGFEKADFDSMREKALAARPARSLGLGVSDPAVHNTPLHHDREAVPIKVAPLQSYDFADA